MFKKSILIFIIMIFIIMISIQTYFSSSMDLPFEKKCLSLGFYKDENGEFHSLHIKITDSPSTNEICITHTVNVFGSLTELLLPKAQLIRVLKIAYETVLYRATETYPPQNRWVGIKIMNTANQKLKDSTTNDVSFVIDDLVKIQVTKLSGTTSIKTIYKITSL